MSRFVKNGSSLLRHMIANGRTAPKVANYWTVNNRHELALRSIWSSTLSIAGHNRWTPNCLSVRGVTSLESDKELTHFLTSEIQLEKQSLEKQTLPTLTDWKVTADGSNLSFTKSFNGEQITVKANVNHTVDASAANDDALTQPNKEQTAGEMISRPDFAIEIKRANKTLGINCSFVEPDIDEDPRGEQLDEMSDSFQIDEISIYGDEFKENSYAVSGDVMDGNMYDMLMDLLQERGIDEQFAKQLIEYSTVYEHTQYVNFLDNLKNFLSK